MSTVLKDRILAELDSVGFGSDEIVNNDLSYSAIAKAIYEYIFNENKVTGLTTGVTTSISTGAVLPFSSEVRPVVAPSLLPVESLKTLLVTTTSTGIPTGATARMFLAIATWLPTAPIMLQVNTTPTGLLSIQPFSGLCIFPAIIPFGITCESQLALTSWPNDGIKRKEKYWEIFAENLNTALNLNIVPPTPTTGIDITGTALYTGVNTISVSFN
jgi:hypothetical protein